MKLIFVNRFFYPDHSATSQILTDLAFELAKDGETIHVVTSRMRYDDPEARLSANEQINGVHVHRVYSTRFGRHWLPGRLMDYLSFYVAATWRLLRLVQKGDVLIAKTDPPLISVPAAWVAKAKGARLINWLQDIFPEVAKALGMKAIPEFMYRMLIAMRNRTLRQAQTNVVLGSVMARRLQEQGIPPEKIAIAPNWAVGPEVKPVAKADNPLRDAWGLEDKFVVGYSGNLGRAHDYQTMLDAIRLLKDEPTIVFLFIGGGANLDKLRQAVEAERLGNVVFKPYQPIEELPTSLAVPDVHWISLLPELEGLIVPSKFYGIMAAGRPTIFVGASDGEISQMLRKHSCGTATQVGDANELLAAILELRDDDERCASYAQAAREAYLAEYTKEQVLKAWSAALVAEAP